MSGEVGDARKRLAEASAERADGGLTGRIDALCGEWERADDLGIQTSYATCAGDLRAILAVSTGGVSE